MQLRFGDIRNPDVPDLPLVLELYESSDRLGEGDLRVGAVELVERNLLELQPAQAPFAGLTEMLGSPVGIPRSRAGPDETTLRCDHEILGIGVQSLCDQFFADVGAIRVSGIDEVHLEVDGTSQHPLRDVPIRWIAPNP